MEFEVRSSLSFTPNLIRPKLRLKWSLVIIFRKLRLLGLRFVWITAEESSTPKCVVMEPGRTAVHSLSQRCEAIETA